MLATVRYYVKKCIPCQLRDPREDREKRQPTPTTGLFQTWNFDVVHVKYGRFQYLISAHDDLSGWPEAVAVVAATSKSVANFIESIIARFGQFRYATVDGGSEFNGMAPVYLRNKGVQLRKTAPYSPESNGMDERMHRTLVDCLYKLSKDRPRNWHKHLPLALLAERISVKRSTGLCPYKMLYTTKPVLPVDLEHDSWLAPSRESVNNTTELLVARVQQMRRRFDDIAKVAKSARRGH